MTIKVYKFGALPVAGDLIRDQMRLGREYYNSLVEAENERRQRIWGGEKVPAPPHEDCVCERCAQKRAEDTKGVHKNCTCNECQEHWNTIRARAKEEPFLDYKPLRAEAVTKGLYWGTYLKIEEAFSAAQKKTKIWHLVRFRSWRQGGLIAVQIQKGGKADRYFRVEKAPDPRTGKRGGQRHRIQIRIGTAKQAPIWSEPVSFEQHRYPLGTPTWVLVTLEYDGDRERWSVQLVCKDVPERTDLAPRGVVAIDVGWRRVEDRLRIALARGDDGEIHHLEMSSKWIELARRADRIRSVRDKQVVEITREDPRFTGVRSPGGVIRRAQDLEIDIGEWVRRDRHLSQYEAGCRRRSVAKRREETRVWLRGLRRRYAHAVIKDSSHKEMKEAADAKLPRPARRQGQNAAPGEVIEEIRKVFGREGVSVVKASNTSAQCSCGHVGKIGAARLVECERCGDVEDRDLRSTRNMMSLYFEGDYGQMTARKTESKFAKRHSNSDRDANASTTASEL
jgi:hypothetical protein